MKKLFFSVLALTVTLGQISAQEASKFENQEAWTPVKIFSQDRSYVVDGFQTQRGTYRMDTSSRFVSDYSLIVDGSHMSDSKWKEVCMDTFNDSRFDKIGRITLRVSGHPWSESEFYDVKLAEGTFKRLSKSQIENSPSIKDARLIYKRESVAIPVSHTHPNGFGNFVIQARSELKRQFLLQKEQFFKTGDLNFDLSEHPYRFIACDLAFGGTSLGFELDMSSEPVKAPMKQWISMTELISLQQVLSDQNLESVELLQAGIAMGKSLEKTNTGLDVFTKNRSKNLLNGLFAPTDGSKSYLLKEMNDKKISEVYKNLLEVDLSNLGPVEQSVYIEMDQLLIHGRD